MNIVDDAGREDVMIQQDVDRSIDLDTGEQVPSVCQPDTATKEPVETKRAGTPRAGFGGKRTPTETITKNAPKSPRKFSPTDPLKGGLGEPGGPIVDDPIERHAEEVPKRFRGKYRGVMSGGTRKPAIRSFCLECMSWDPKVVEACTSPQCVLYKWRIDG